jgi:hypothetical protein
MIDPRKALMITEDLKAGFSANFAARRAKVSHETAYRIRRSMLASGALHIVVVKGNEAPTRLDLNKTGQRLARTIYKNLFPLVVKKLAGAEVIRWDDIPEIEGLTGRTRQLLSLLWHASGRTLQADFLIDQVWGDNDIDLANLRVQICKLRRVIKYTGARINTYENPSGYSLPRGEREKIIAMNEIVHLPALPRLSIHV